MRIICTFLLALIFLPGILLAQPATVKGKVITETGDPIIYATIKIKGTAKATSADDNGDFSLLISKYPSVLQLSAVGYKSTEFTITVENSSRPITITLKRDLADRDEVVVTGYTRTDKSAPSTPPTSVTVQDLAVSGLDKASHKASGTTKKEQSGYSRILTAGELNDFKKWKLWGDYNASEFSSLSQHWMMAFGKRYCVQVQNTKHRPIVGERVYLLNEDTRDTVWQAVTDNTGKAELWADQDPAFNEQANYNIICSNQSIRFPVLFENGINRISIKRVCNVPNAVDIAFVVDATGSMGDEIRYLQSEVLDIIDNTTSKYKDINLRLASVFYRDHGDEYLTRSFDFQSDGAQVVNFIKKQSARGGGDFPEAVENGLQVALDSLQWSSEARTRILFLVLDAPPHDAAKEKMEALIQKAAAKGIRIIPVACSGVNKSTEYLLRCAALATNGCYIFLTDDSGVGNPHIKPTTDEFKVELLNELMQRLIAEMIYTPACNEQEDPTLLPKDTVNSTVKVAVYPNPTQGKLTVESSGTIQQLYVTDFTGKILMKLESGKNKRKWQLHLSTYPSGTYLVKYFIEDKGWGAEKVVLIH